MKKISIPLALFLCIIFKINAQQLPLTNQYLFAPGIINPSMISVYKKMEVFGLLRKQWTDVAGAPNSQIITLNGNIKKDKSFIGATIIHDNIGLWSQLSFYGNFAYRARFNEDMALDFGVSLGGIQRTFEFNRVLVKDNDDPFLSSNSLSRFTFDGSFGLSFIWKDLKVGISSFQLFSNQVRYLESSNQFSYRMNRQLNANLQYRFILSESSKMYLIPIFVGRYTTQADKFNISAPLQYDGSLLFDMTKYGWLFISYKSDYALSSGIGFHINNAFHFGFSYDFAVFSSVQQYIGQTAEISFRYTFKSSGNTPQFLY